MLKIKYNSKSLFAYCLLYRIILELYYVYSIVPSYSYIGYNSDSTRSQYTLSWVYYLVMSLFFIKAYNSKDRFWANFSFVLYLIKFVPTTILLAYNNYETGFIITNLIFWLLFLVLYNYTPSVKIFSYNFIRKNARNFKFLLLGIICLFIVSVLFVWVKYTGCHFQMSLFDVYDIRFEQREKSYPVVFSYILASSTLLCPLILSYIIDKKKYLLVILFTFIIYLDFSIDGIKSIVFATVIGILLKFYYKQIYRKYMPLVGSILFLVFLFINNEEINKLISLVIWRIFFCPGGMDYEYYTFFNIFEPDYYRNSVLRRLGFESPYASSSVDITVGEYFNPGIEGIRANNGLLSEAYANFGIELFFLYTFLLVFYLKIISSCAKGLDESYMFLIATILTYTIISTIIPTTFLSSGIWIMLLFLIAYRAEKCFLKLKSM